MVREAIRKRDECSVIDIVVFSVGASFVIVIFTTFIFVHKSLPNKQNGIIYQLETSFYGDAMKSLRRQNATG